MGGLFAANPCEMTQEEVVEVLINHRDKTSYKMSRLN